MYSGLTGFGAHFHKRPFSFQNQLQSRSPKFRSPSEFAENAENAFLQKMQKTARAQSRRHERPRSSRLQHSASFRATKPNKASMTSMLAAAMILAIGALERQLAPLGFECCERQLLGRSWRRDWGMHRLHAFVDNSQEKQDVC